MKYIITLLLLISSIYANDIKFESKEEKVNTNRIIYLSRV